MTSPPSPPPDRSAGPAELDQAPEALPAEVDLLDRRRGEPRVPVRTGHWSYELRGSEIADLRWRDTLLLRAIRPVVRDRDWNTTPPRIATTAADLDATADRVTLELLFEDETVELAGRLQVNVVGDTVEVSFETTARRECWCNRVGLVVLHPPAVAGSPVVALHGSPSADQDAHPDREESRWPVDISPHQPFADVSGFEWTTPDGVAARVAARLRFAGDVFETEDQRNWTDASFKTYSTPLSRPFPVRHLPGATVTQSVTLTAVPVTEPTTEPTTELIVGAGDDVGPLTSRRASTRTVAAPAAVAGDEASADEASADVVVGPDAGRVPQLTTMASLYPVPSPGLRLRAGVFAALLVELNGDTDRWPALLTAAADQARELGCGLDLRIVTDQPDRLAWVVDVVASRSPGMLRLAAFDPTSHLTSPSLWQAMQELQLPAGTELVAGTRAHFTELNRNVARLPTDAAAVTFSLTPQMHATELDHIVESLPMQHAVAANAHRLLPGRRLHIGPITLARRFNAVATTGPRPPEVDAAYAIDPLQPTRFTAAWTLGSVAALSSAGVESLCYFEVAGPRGLSIDGEPTPAGRLLEQLAGLRGQPLRTTAAPHNVFALAVRGTRGETHLWLGDLSGNKRTVRVRDRIGGPSAKVELPAWGVVSLLL